MLQQVDAIDAELPPLPTKREDVNALMLDTGTTQNIIGRKTLTKFVDTANDHGYKTGFTANKKSYFTGLGGRSPTDVTAAIPITMTTEESKDSKNTEVMSFHTHVIEGEGADFPALLGLRGLQDLDAVLVVREGQETMILPGEEGFSISCSSGTRAIPLSYAPSGQLTMTCDAFEDAQRKDQPSRRTKSFQLKFGKKPPRRSGGRGEASQR